MAQTLREWLTPIGVIAGIAFLAWFVWDDLDKLQDDVHSIEIRIAVLESEVANLNERVARIEEDVSQLREDYSRMREDIAEIRAILLNRQPASSDIGESSTPSAAQPSGPAVTRKASEQP